MIQHFNCFIILIGLVHRAGILIVSTATCCTQQLNGNTIIFFLWSTNITCYSCAVMKLVNP